ALAASSGEYVAFLDSDDQWIPDKLNRQVETMAKKPSLGLVCSNAALASNGVGKGKLYLRQDQGKSGAVFLSLLQDNFVVTSTVMVRRSVLQSVGSFCEERALRGVEDYDLWLRIAARSELAFLPEALAIYQLSPTSLGREQGGALHWTSLLRM